MGLFVALTRWTDHLGVSVAMAEVEERCAEAVLSKAQSLVLLRDWGGTRDDRITVAKAQRDIDPEVEERQDIYHTAVAYRKMIATLYASTERDAAVVSRELTRRVGRREDHDRRASRWTP